MLLKRSLPHVFALCLLGIYQFLHSFDPSRPYTVQIVETRGISNEELYGVIQPFRSYFLIPATLLTGAALEFLGYRAALLMEALALVVSMTLMALCYNPITGAMLRASMVFGSFSFATGFLVNAAMFHTLPLKFWQLGSSVSSVAMMAGLFLSGILGQALLSLLHSYWNLLYASLGVSVFIVLLLLVGFLSNALPPAHNHMSIRNSFPVLWATFKAYYSSLGVLRWSTFNAITLGVHTLVNQTWKSLFKQIDPSSGSRNGSFQAFSYAAASGVLLMAAFIPPKVTKKIANVCVLWLAPLIISGLFVLMGLATKISVALGIYIVYNAVSELVLMLSQVLLGEEMSHVDVPEQAKQNREPLPAEDKPADTLQQSLLPHSAEDGTMATEEVRTIVEESKEQKKPVSEEQRKQAKFINFAVVFTFNAIVSIILQDLVQFLCGKSVLGLKVNLWFLVYGGITLVLGAVLLVSSLILCLRRRRAESVVVSS